MDLAEARRVADTVLYEGYLLYPYRSDSAKNHVRWQYGIVGPKGAEEAGVGESDSLETKCLVDMTDASPDPHVAVQVRFLQVQHRTVERVLPDGGFEPVEELRVGPARWVPWHEAVERQVDIDLRVAGLDSPLLLPVSIPGGEEVELLTSEEGDLLGRLVRTRWGLCATLRVSADRVADGRGLLLTSQLHNDATWAANTDELERSTARDLAARTSFVGTHLLMQASGCAFASLIDPPQWAAASISAVRNARCWPVLMGVEGDTDMLMACPIILPDYPTLAPESPGQLFDCTEIDEILTLRIMTLTDEEKLNARGTDPRAASIIDQCDEMPPEIFERLHGALRSLDGERVAVEDLFPVLHTDPAGNLKDADVPWWDPGTDESVSPETDRVVIDGIAVSKGSRVLLRPRRRADAQDLFIAGMVGRVSAVYSDVDGETHVAVVLEDDPAGDLHEWYGRYYYFGCEELKPLPPLPDLEDAQ